MLYGIDWDSLVLTSRPRPLNPWEYSDLVPHHLLGQDVAGWGLGLGLGRRFRVLETWTTHGAVACVDALLRQCHDGFIGIDLEWIPDWQGQDNPVALMQLCCGTTVVLLRTSFFPTYLNSTFTWLPPNLCQALNHPDNTLVTVAWGNDRRKLQNTFNVTPACQVVDVQVVAREQGRRHLGVKALTQELLTPEYNKSEYARFSDWCIDDWLSEKQVSYAALDAILPLYLHRRLTDGSLPPCYY